MTTPRYWDDARHIAITLVDASERVPGYFYLTRWKFLVGDHGYRAGVEDSGDQIMAQPGWLDLPDGRSIKVEYAGTCIEGQHHEGAGQIELRVYKPVGQ